MSRYRRRRARLYLRGHLGCSVPLLIGTTVLIKVLALVLT